MFNSIRIATAAAVVALLASTGAQANAPKDTSSWVNAELAAPTTTRDPDARFAARAGHNDTGANSRIALRAVSVPAVA
jgi:hypothetical protein